MFQCKMKDTQTHGLIRAFLQNARANQSNCLEQTHTAEKQTIVASYKQNL